MAAALADNGRQERGLMLAKAKPKAFRQISDDTYLVPSATTAGSVYVVRSGTNECTCPDFETHRSECKHLWALRYFRQEITMPDGTSVVTEVRLTYSQDCLSRVLGLVIYYAVMLRPFQR